LNCPNIRVSGARAIEKLANHLALLTEVVKAEGDAALVERLRSAWKRATVEWVLARDR
jgi:hypothetical protein